MNFKKYFTIFCCILLIANSCTPDRAEYPDEGDWLIPALPHAITMSSGDAVDGTYNFFEFIYSSEVDKGVCYDRFMTTLLTYNVPGLADKKWTIFVLNNEGVKNLSLDYFGNSDILSGANSTAEYYQSFKLLQYYIMVGEYRTEDFGSKLVMDNGVEITVSGNTLIGAEGNTVNIISANNEARNGIFHVIDGPLHPFKANYQYIDKSYLYDYGTEN